MKKIITHCIFTLFTTFIYTNETSAQTTLSVHSPLLIQPGTTVFVGGSFVGGVNGALTNNGTFILHSSVTTTWTDTHGGTGIMNLASTGLTRFTGSQLRTFSGTTMTSFYDVDMANSGGLSLGVDMEIRHALKMFSGSITTNSFWVNNVFPSSLGIKADMTNPKYATSWINGNVRRLMPSAVADSFDFPVGTASTSNLLILADNALTGGGFTQIECWFQSPKPGTDAGMMAGEPSGGTYTQALTHGVWHFVPNANPASGRYGIALYLNGFSGMVDNSYGPVLRPNYSTLGSDWYVPFTSTLNAFGSSGRIVLSNFAARNTLPSSAFGQWGIGESVAPLPVELLYFKGIHSEGVVNLFWATASESNVNYFEIEKSNDGESFMTLSDIPASGTSTTLHTYSRTDTDPSSTNYYRLKIVDHNTAFEYSSVIRASTSLSEDEISVIGEYVLLMSRQTGRKQLQLLSIDGKMILDKNISIQEGATFEKLPSIPRGMYVARVCDTSTGTYTHVKFVR